MFSQRCSPACPAWPQLGWRAGGCFPPRHQLLHHLSAVGPRCDGQGWLYVFFAMQLSKNVFSQLAVADGQFCRGDLWLCQALNSGPRRSGRYHQRMIPKGQSQQKSREIGEIKIWNLLVWLALWEKLSQLTHSWRKHQKCSEGSVGRC